jgi:hypothetical protein
MARRRFLGRGRTPTPGWASARMGHFPEVGQLTRVSITMALRGVRSDPAHPPYGCTDTDLPPAGLRAGVRAAPPPHPPRAAGVRGVRWELHPSPGGCAVLLGGVSLAGVAGDPGGSVLCTVKSWEPQFGHSQRLRFRWGHQ